MATAKVETKTKGEEKKVYKVRLRIFGTKAVIFRDLMPSIEDKTEEAVKWLAAHDYKESDIEIIGEKPAIWDTVYPQPVKEPEANPVAVVV
jgi:hypothetical protein